MTLICQIALILKRKSQSIRQIIKITVQIIKSQFRHMAITNQEPEEDNVKDEKDEEVMHDDLLADKDGDVDNLVEERDYTALG